MLVTKENNRHCIKLNYDKAFLYISFALYLGKTVKAVKAKEEAKKEIKAKAPERYAKMCEQSVEGTYVNWAKEAEKVRDSLRIDSIAKTNYAKGLNLVKDTAKVIK